MRAGLLDRNRWVKYGAAAVLVVAMTLLGLWAQPIVAPSDLVMLYLAAVALAARYLGPGPAAVCVLLSAGAVRFVFGAPGSDFAITNRQSLFTLIGMVIVGALISALTSQARGHAAAAESRERQASIVYEFTRDLAAAGHIDAVLQTIITHVGRAFDRPVAVLLPDAEHRLAVRAAAPGFALSAGEQAAAGWAFEHGRPARHAAADFGTARLRCLPLDAPSGRMGVLAVAYDGRPEPDAEQVRLLDVLAVQAALAVERAQLAAHAQQVSLLQATEKLQSALLHSISHDLRTPLAAMTVAFSNLEAAGDRLDPATREALARTGRQEAERLNHLVGNLLEMSRIEAGALKVTEEPGDVEEAIGVALDRLAPPPEARPVGVAEVDERAVTVELPADLPTVLMDLPLIVQALVNVLDNAVKYSPPGSPIEISARQAGDELEIRVADRGPGIRAEDRERIFDKFYRVRRPGEVAGTGLGLAITKGIVEAHGGRIWAGERPEGGTVMTIALPLSRIAAASPERAPEGDDGA